MSRPKLNGHRKRAAVNVDAPDIAPLVQKAVAPDQATGGVSVINAPVFSQGELEQLAWRRYNPLSQLTALKLSAALDQYQVGLPVNAARLWHQICLRDETISSVKSKREESVALREYSVAPLDDSPAAADQAAALTNFYRSVRATEALNRHATGGFPRLCMQMMEAISFGYAAHHLIWKPDATRTWKLPSGRMVPTLMMQAEYTPLEFFEFRTGELRFLGMNQGITGEPLDPGAWMVTSATPLMMAGSALHWYKRLAQHDLVNFSEKFGTPGLVVHTTAAQGSPEGISARSLARDLSGNYRGVQYGASDNKIEVIWPSGGTGSGNLPMNQIIEDARRELAILWLGADLSTMSRGGQGVGASIQGEEQAKRERSDCARISETLNATLDPLVLRWYFGDQAPILARVYIEAPVNEDKSALWNLVAGMVSLGAQVPVATISNRLNVPTSPDGPEFFAAPQAPEAPIGNQGAAAIAENAAPIQALDEGDKVTLAPLLKNSSKGFLEAVAGDQAPLATAIRHVLAANDDDFLETARRLDAALPHLGSQIIAANGSAQEIEKILAAAIATGLSSGEEPPFVPQ